MDQTQPTSTKTEESARVALGLPGFEYADLYDPMRLTDLLAAFNELVRKEDPELADAFEKYRSTQGASMAATAISELLVRMAPHVGRFLARLFDVENARRLQARAIQDQVETIFTYRNEVVQRAPAKYKGANVGDWDVPGLDRTLVILKRAVFPGLVDEADAEQAVARLGTHLYRLLEHFQHMEQGKPI